MAATIYEHVREQQEALRYALLCDPRIKGARRVKRIWSALMQREHVLALLVHAWLDIAEAEALPDLMSDELTPEVEWVN